jgi:hypothetical protein
MRTKEGKKVNKIEVNLNHQNIGNTSAARPTNISKTNAGKCTFRSNDNLAGHRNRPNMRKILPVMSVVDISSSSSSSSSSLSSFTILTS